MKRSGVVLTVFVLRSTELRGDVAVIIGHLRDNLADLMGPYGVLLFLYSVVFTKVFLQSSPFLLGSLHTCRELIDY